MLPALALLYTFVVPPANAQAGQDATRPFQPPTFADSVFAYVYGPAYRNPFITSAAQPRGADIVRNGIEFKHVDAWRYGHNLVELVAKKSARVEPGASGGSGARAFYAIFRSGISINRVAHRPLIALGPLRDIDIQAGLNFQEKHTDMSPNERTLYLGPNFQFAFGRGILNVALQLRKERNHNGILGRNENFDTNFNIEPVWHIPLHIGGLNFMLEGYAEYNSPKGRDAFGHDTRAEVFARPQLKFDLGPVFGLSPGKLEMAVGIEYWRNKFGQDADRVPGANQLTPVGSLIVHWPMKGAAH